MIVKELDPFTATDPLALAGRAAEEQMAFYLRRAFGSAEDVRIFHGLRLQRDGDAAQIDHLVLHRWGMLLIESKSVTTRIRVNAQEEWTRWQGGRWQGMPSPVLQVGRQATFLRARLREHADELLGKVLGLQIRFGNMPLDTLVAISDNGIIERPRGALPEVCKADQIPAQITVLLETYRKANSPLGMLVGKDRYFWHTFKPEELTRVMQFLRHQHCPLRLAGAGTPIPLAEPPSAIHHPDTAFPEPVGGSPVPPALAENAVCATCGKLLSAAVTRYCEDHAGRFGGQVYCMAHQRAYPAVLSTEARQPPSPLPYRAHAPAGEAAPIPVQPRPPQPARPDTAPGQAALNGREPTAAFVSLSSRITFAPAVLPATDSRPDALQEVTLNFKPKEGIRIPFQKLFFAPTATEVDMQTFFTRVDGLLAPGARLTLSKRVAANPHARPAPGEGWRLVLKFRCADSSIVQLQIEHYQPESDVNTLVQKLLGKLCNSQGSPAVAVVQQLSSRVTYV